jgi:hypothetical protein
VLVVLAEGPRLLGIFEGTDKPIAGLKIKTTFKKIRAEDTWPRVFFQPVQ